MYEITDFEFEFTTINGKLSSDITISGKSWVPIPRRDKEKQLDYILTINKKPGYYNPNKGKY